MSFFTVLLLILAIALVIGLFFLWFLKDSKAKAGESLPASNEPGDLLSLKASVTALNKKLDLLHERIYALEKKPAKKGK